LCVLKMLAKTGAHSSSQHGSINPMIHAINNSVTLITARLAALVSQSRLAAPANVLVQPAGLQVVLLSSRSVMAPACLQHQPLCPAQLGIGLVASSAEACLQESCDGVCFGSRGPGSSMGLVY
jgi:hypothetical protein